MVLELFASHQDGQDSHRGVGWKLCSQSGPVLACLG